VVTPALTFVADALHRGETTICGAHGQTWAGAIRGGGVWQDSRGAALLEKLRAGSESLGALVADPGVHTGNCARHLVLPQERATPDAVPVLEGKQVSRYHCAAPSKVLRLGYRPKDGEYFTIRAEDKYARAPFVIRQTAPYPMVGPRKHAIYFRNSLLALYPPSNGVDVRYLVGVLNSALMRYAYGQLVPESRQKVFPQVKVGSLRELPIRRIDLSSATDKAQHDQMVKLVEELLGLQERLATARTPQERAALERQIEDTDRRIDRTVYALYELTEEEIRMVEEG